MEYPLQRGFLASRPTITHLTIAGPTVHGAPNGLFALEVVDVVGGSEAEAYSNAVGDDRDASCSAENGGRPGGPPAKLGSVSVYFDQGHAVSAVFFFDSQQDLASVHQLRCEPSTFYRCSPRLFLELLTLYLSDGPRKLALSITALWKREVLNYIAQLVRFKEIRLGFCTRAHDSQIPCVSSDAPTKIRPSADVPYFKDALLRAASCARGDLCLLQESGVNFQFSRTWGFRLFERKPV
ncbi:hypothetical protein FB451DRAFT_1172490 [Mycena latifolia]|nr:hypothetical protein FB451DRAFT_1172490 [Mycena latifolia]